MVIYSKKLIAFFCETHNIDTTGYQYVHVYM